MQTRTERELLSQVRLIRKYAVSHSIADLDEACARWAASGLAEKYALFLEKKPTTKRRTH